LQSGHIYIGDARELLRRIEPESIALSVWSPPYFVGKSYEQHMTYDEWRALLAEVIRLHYPIVRPGGFVAINIADILCFRDPTMPRVQADSVDRKRSPVTREAVLEAMARHPHLNRYQLAQLLGCSEQTIDRRLRGNNVRGGKYAPQTRVHLVGGTYRGVVSAVELLPIRSAHLAQRPRVREQPVVHAVLPLYRRV
jgi:hypothetical protein